MTSARRFLSGIATLALMTTTALAADDILSLDLETSAIEHFQIGRPDVTRFGDLIFAGGLEVESDNRALGALSGLVVPDGGASLLAVADDGHLFKATILRDASGRVTGLDGGEIKSLGAVDGDHLHFKWEADTEALDIWQSADGPRAAISFEGVPRIVTGRIAADGFASDLTDVALPKSMSGIRNTKGLEALAVVPPASPDMTPDLIAIAERAERKAGTDDRPGWRLGANPIRFRVKAVGDYDITDAKIGPGGDLFILERLYSLAEGVRMRIRRIDDASLADGATVDGPVVMEANLSHQIDNMEGLSFWTDSSGQTRLSLVSDDNRSFLQRTLYLEFIYAPE